MSDLHEVYELLIEAQEKPPAKESSMLLLESNAVDSSKSIRNFLEWNKQTRLNKTKSFKQSLQHWAITYLKGNNCG